MKLPVFFPIMGTNRFEHRPSHEAQLVRLIHLAKDAVEKVSRRLTLQHRAVVADPLTVHSTGLLVRSRAGGLNEASTLAAGRSKTSHGFPSTSAARRRRTWLL
jgi:hypothetical protein